MSEQNESQPLEMQDLIAALNNQTKALASLANSNAMLAQAIMAQVDDEEQPQTAYLDGSKIG